MNVFSSVARGLAVGLILSLGLCGYASAEDLDGTWQLVMRKLPDGTVQTPPAVQGRFTVKNGVAQLVVFWPTPNGTPASLSELSRWEWSENEVAATPLLVIFDDGSGKPALYAVGGETKRTPVARQGARVSYQHPIDAPFIVWEANKLTATLEGEFVDYWERVR